MKKKTWNIIIRHVVLAFLAFIWLVPIVWLFVTSLSTVKGVSGKNFFPKHWTLANYNQLFFHTDTAANFPAWFKNTFIVALFTCIISSLFVLMVSYAFSCMRFKGRKKLMSFSIILGMFPGVLSMIAVYFVLKMLGLVDSLAGLIFIYSAGSGLGFLILKGFFDTIPKALDEAAIIDGATKWQTFTKITIPLSKPIIVYTVLTSFMAPWLDFIFAKVICRADATQYTVSIGLWKMLEKEYIDSWYTCFAAGAVVVSVPIAILFLITQKFYVEGMSGAVKG